MLWGLPLELYSILRMDYDNVDMLFDLKDPLYDTYRRLMLNGAAVFRQEIRTEGRYVPGVSGPTSYVAVLKYTHMGHERPPDKFHQTVGGPRVRRPPFGMQSQLVEMLPTAGPGRKVYAPLAETIDGKEPSRRIILEAESAPHTPGAQGPERYQEVRIEAEARDAARDVAVAGYPRTFGPCGEASRMGWKNVWTTPQRRSR